MATDPKLLEEMRFAGTARTVYEDLGNLTRLVRERPGRRRRAGRFLDIIKIEVKIQILISKPWRPFTRPCNVP
jgi:hypothetical protein